MQKRFDKNNSIVASSLEKDFNLSSTRIAEGRGPTTVVPHLTTVDTVAPELGRGPTTVVP